MCEQCPPPFEDEYPETAKILQDIINKKHPVVKGMYAAADGVTFSRWPVKAAPSVGRNDPCPCGSGNKYKKCCLK